jgi:hypothetical protein
MKIIEKIFEILEKSYLIRSAIKDLFRIINGIMNNVLLLKYSLSFYSFSK